MDLGYLNTRVRGWRGLLLRKSDYDTLISFSDFDKYVDYLKGTSYGPDLKVAEARAEEGYSRFGSALRSNLARSFASLWKVAPEEAEPLLKAVFSTWESYSLKTLLRGIDRTVGKEELFEALLPAGEFDSAALRELSASKDIPDLLSRLRTWQSPWAKPVGAGIAAYKDHHSLFEMELAIDRFCSGYFSDNFGSPGRLGSGDEMVVVKKVLEDRADGRNVMTLLSTVGEGYAPSSMEEFFIDGGRRLGKGAYMEMVKVETRKELLTVLPEVISDSSWSDLLYRTGEDDLDSVSEGTFDLTAADLRNLAVIDPLSIAMSAAYVFSKVREIRNLRLLARAKIFSIPDEEVRKSLRYH